MRCVCFYCSRLLIDKDSPRVKEIIKKTSGNLRRRLALIYDLCKSKTVCESGEDLAQANEVCQKSFNINLFSYIFLIQYYNFIQIL